MNYSTTTKDKNGQDEALLKETYVVVTRDDGIEFRRRFIASATSDYNNSQTLARTTTIETTPNSDSLLVSLSRRGSIIYVILVKMAREWLNCLRESERKDVSAIHCQRLVTPAILMQIFEYSESDSSQSMLHMR